MSKLTQCNYCTLKQLEIKYNQTLLQNKEPIPEFPEGVGIYKNGKVSNKNLLCWFAKLPDKCEC